MTMIYGMRPGWIAVDAGTRQPIQDALADTPNRKYLCAYVNPSASPAIGSVGTGVHYLAAEQRLMGERAFEAWLTL